MKNVYWTIKYSNGWLDSHCHFTRKDAIASFINGINAGKSWAWHKRHQKVSVVRVEIKELSK